MGNAGVDVEVGTKVAVGLGCAVRVAATARLISRAVAVDTAPVSTAGAGRAGVGGSRVAAAKGPADGVAAGAGNAKVARGSIRRQPVRRARHDTQVGRQQGQHGDSGECVGLSRTPSGPGAGVHVSDAICPAGEAGRFVERRRSSAQIDPTGLRALRRARRTRLPPKGEVWQRVASVAARHLPPRHPAPRQGANPDAPKAAQLAGLPIAERRPARPRCRIGRPDSWPAPSR